MVADPSEAVAESLRRWAWGRDGVDCYMLDVAAITTQTSDLLSESEQQVLQVVASLVGGAPVRLDELGSVDRRTLDLVLAAIAHASGSHQQSEGSVHPWPGA